MSAYDPTNRDLDDGAPPEHEFNKRSRDLWSSGERLRKQRAQDRAQLQERLARHARYVPQPQPQASRAKSLQRSYGRARSQPQRQKSGTPPWLLFSVAVATGILFVLGSKPRPQRRVRPLSNPSRTMDYTSPASSSAYPDGPGIGDQHLPENTGVLGSDPYVDNDATEWDRNSKTPPVAETAMNKKQGWGETQAKSDGTFPSDGSHLVSRAKSHPAGSEKGSSFGTGAPVRAPSSGEGLGSGSPLSTAAGGGPAQGTRSGIGAPASHGSDQAGNTNIGRPTVGKTGEFRNAEGRIPTDRTKITE